MELVPMTAEEFARVREPLVRSYAEAMTADRGLPPAAALERATTQLREQLPDGVDSAGALLRTARVGDVEVKKKLAKALNAAMDPLRERRAHYEQHPERVTEIIHEGSRKARAIAVETMQRVREALHLAY